MVERPHEGSDMRRSVRLVEQHQKNPARKQIPRTTMALWVPDCGSCTRLFTSASYSCIVLGYCFTLRASSLYWAPVSAIKWQSGKEWYTGILPESRGKLRKQCHGGNQGIPTDWLQSDSIGHFLLILVTCFFELRLHEEISTYTIMRNC